MHGPHSRSLNRRWSSPARQDRRDTVPAEVTVPAGIVSCYEAVHTSRDTVGTEWWAAEEGLLTPVIMVDESN